LRAARPVRCINELDVYRGLGVREVWFWHEGRFQLYELRADGFAPIARSGLLSELDVEELATFADDPDQLAP
jgi:hypothetical protein